MRVPASFVIQLYPQPITVNCFLELAVIPHYHCRVRNMHDRLARSRNWQ
jgi:hypothetical protein